MLGQTIAREWPGTCRLSNSSESDGAASPTYVGSAAPVAACRGSSNTLGIMLLLPHPWHGFTADVHTHTIGVCKASSGGWQAGMVPTCLQHCIVNPLGWAPAHGLGQVAALHTTAAPTQTSGTQGATAVHSGAVFWSPVVSSPCAVQHVRRPWTVLHCTAGSSAGVHTGRPSPCAVLTPTCIVVPPSRAQHMPQPRRLDALLWWVEVDAAMDAAIAAWTAAATADDRQQRRQHRNASSRNGSCRHRGQRLVRLAAAITWLVVLARTRGASGV